MKPLILFLLLSTAACMSRKVMGKYSYDQNGNAIYEKKNKRYRSPLTKEQERYADSVINKLMEQ